MPDAFQNKYINEYLLIVALLLVHSWVKERGAGWPCNNLLYCSRTWQEAAAGHWEPQVGTAEPFRTAGVARQGTSRGPPFFALRELV